MPHRAPAGEGADAAAGARPFVPLPLQAVHVEDDPAAVHAASGVDLGERGDDALPHALSEHGGGAFERGRLADQDAIPADTDLIGPGRARGDDEQDHCQGDACRRSGSFHDALAREYGKIRRER